MPEPTRSTAGGTSASETQRWTSETGTGSENIKEKASQAASQAVRQAGEQVRSAGEQIRESAQATAEQVKQQGAGFVQDRKNQATEQLSSFGAAIRSAADRLNEDNDPNLAAYAEATAERVEGAARYLNQHGFSDIAGDLEGFARRQPELFLGGMFLAGMGLSRFLKASREKLPRGQQTSSAGSFEPAPGYRTPTQYTGV